MNSYVKADDILQIKKILNNTPNMKCSDRHLTTAGRTDILKGRKRLVGRKSKFIKWEVGQLGRM